MMVPPLLGENVPPLCKAWTWHLCLPGSARGRMGLEPETFESWTPHVVTEVRGVTLSEFTRHHRNQLIHYGLSLQRAPLRGTTADTRHPVAVDEVAGVQEDRDWAPGGEDLHPGDQGEA